MAGEDTETQQPAQAEGETAENQIATLVKELQSQNESLGGNLLITVPVSREDARQVFLFRTTMSFDRNGMGIATRRGAYGVHPDKGAIEVNEANVQGVNGVAKYINQFDYGQKHQPELNDRTFGELDSGSNAKTVEDEAVFGRWQQSYDISKRRAQETIREEEAKRQFLPKALEAVRPELKPMGQVVQDTAVR